MRQACWLQVGQEPDHAGAAWEQESRHLRQNAAALDGQEARFRGLGCGLRYGRVLMVTVWAGPLRLKMSSGT